MDKKRIMIDMDDVIYEGWFLNLMNDYLGTTYKEEDFPGYYMQDIIPKEKQEDFFNWMLTNDIYDYGNLLPNVYETLKKLNDKYNLCIGTAYIIKELPMESGKILLSQKYERLLSVFDFLTPKQIILVNDKSFINAHIKVDDLVSNLEGAEIKLLFSSYHNKDITDLELKEKGIIRVSSWLEVEEMLKDV